MCSCAHTGHTTLVMVRWGVMGRAVVARGSAGREDPGRDAALARRAAELAAGPYYCRPWEEYASRLTYVLQTTIATSFMTTACSGCLISQKLKVVTVLQKKSARMIMRGRAVRSLWSSRAHLFAEGGERVKTARARSPALSVGLSMTWFTTTLAVKHVLWVAYFPQDALRQNLPHLRGVWPPAPQAQEVRGTQEAARSLPDAFAS